MEDKDATIEALKEEIADLNDAHADEIKDLKDELDTANETINDLRSALTEIYDISRNA